MKKTLLASLIGLAITPTAYSYEHIELDDVIVTATRTTQPRENTVADVTVINREEIERAGANSLTDLLRLQPGVQVSNSGGAGQASSVYLRGTNQEHTVVLVDGLRINSATSGVTSFQSIPLSQIEKIEILRGPASSLYGADAIGGVIQIFTKKGSADKPLLHAAVGVGSFNTKTAEAGISGSFNDTQYGINLSSFDTDGFSARRIRSKTTKDSDDDGYNNVSVSAYLEHTIFQGHSLGIQFFQSQNHNNYDGNVNFDNYGEQTLQSYALTSKNQFTDFWHSTIRLGQGSDKSDDHTKPSGSNPSGESQFDTQQNQYLWQNDFTLPLGTLTLLYERLEQRVTSSTNYNKNHRDNNAYAASYLLNADNHSLQLSLRQDRNTQFGNYTTGGIGYGYHLTPEWSVSANYGKAFKAPSFNQLYFPNFGDPTLQPEQSKNVEASLKYEASQLHAGISVFENNISNLIANAGPATTGCTIGGFCPINIGKVNIQGVTFDASWQVDDYVTLNGNFTVQSPRDEDANNLLIRRSNRYGALGLLHTWHDLQWGAELTGASTRYNNATNTKKMGGYMLVNLTANYKLNPEWKLEARANNILDKEYVLAYTGNASASPAYNTAGSNLFVGLRYDMKP